jgi:hypothetical protein
MLGDKRVGLAQVSEDLGLMCFVVQTRDSVFHPFVLSWFWVK